MRFAERIADIKTAALAERTETHPDTVRAWKRGEIVPTDPAKILALAEVLGLDAAELLSMLADDTKTRTSRVIPGAAA